MFLKEILKESTVICQNCKDIYEPSSIFKHIGNNKVCKTFYGEDYQRLKKEKERLRMKKYQLAKQREAYASDKKIRESKKESNKKTKKTYMDKKSALREKLRIEDEKKNAKFKFEFKKNTAKESNSLWRKKLQWVIDCFQHFLETFPQTNGSIKIEMANIENSIKCKYEKMDTEINEILEKVKYSEDSRKIDSAFLGNKKENGLYEGGKNENDIKHEWQVFEQFHLGRRLENILENINESERKSEWYYRIQIIQGRFKEKFKGWWEEHQEYTKFQTCIICGQEPNCLEKNWLTRIEFKKVQFTVNL